MSKKLNKKYEIIDSCKDTPEALRLRLKEVLASLERTDAEMIDYIEKSTNVGDKMYDLNEKMEQMVCCSLCQILYGWKTGTISRNNAQQLISLFITDPVRVDKLFLLCEKNGDNKCHHKEIKEAMMLQPTPLEEGDERISIGVKDIQLCGEIDNENATTMAPAVNRIMLFKGHDGYKNMITMLEIINYGRTRWSATPESTKEYTKWVSDIIKQLNWKPGQNQPHICNHKHEQNGPYNFNYKPSVPANNIPMPSALNIAQTSSIANEVNTGVGWTPMGAINNMMASQTIKINPNKLNQNWKLIEMSLDFPETTSQSTKDAVIQKIFDNYGQYVKLVNQIPAVKKYKVDLIDGNNFTLSGMNPDKTLKAVMEVKGNMFLVKTDPVNVSQGLDTTQVSEYYNMIYHHGVDPRSYDMNQIMAAKA